MASATDDRSALDLIRLARKQLGHIEDQIKWRTSELDGIRVTETVGGRSNIAADPTATQAHSRKFVAGKIDKARDRLSALVDATLPSIYGTLSLDDERRRESDDNPTRPDMGATSIHGGVSAYRGDRNAPKGRPDLKESLDAQHRRLERDEGYGHA